MLTNYDLMKIARELKFPSLVVVSKDDLKKIKPNVGNFIINLENKQDGNGTHWTSFIIYKENQKIKSFYCDSYGMLPPIEVEQFIHSISNEKIPYNNRMIQKINTSECGWYCLSFLYNMNFKRKYSSFYDNFLFWISKFSNDLNEELKILEKSFCPYHVNFYTKQIKKCKCH